jgi:hypothetical protein
MAAEGENTILFSLAHDQSTFRLLELLNELSQLLTATISIPASLIICVNTTIPFTLLFPSPRKFTG